MQRVSSQHSPVEKLAESQLTIPWRDPSSELELAINGQPLIPGIPEDVALNCLLRLPVESHTSCRAVCKRWRLLLSSKEKFFMRRKELGFHEPWLFVYAFCKLTKKARWQVLDLNHFAWHTIPSMPCKNMLSPQGFSCVSIPHEGILFVCGGTASNVDCPLDSVLKYEMHKNTWTVMNQMITARSFFASGVINGMVYIAGGNSDDLSEEFELANAEVLDPAKGRWRPIARMGANMAPYDSAVLDGKLLVTEGWLWPFFVAPRGQVYDPTSGNWETMAIGLREGWRGSSVVLYERLFVVSDHERMKLRVYDKGSDSWETVEGPLPEQICKPFSVSSCGSKIYVVGRGLHVAIGHILRIDRGGGDDKKGRFSVRWHVVNAPDSSSELTPSYPQVLFG